MYAYVDLGCVVGWSSVKFAVGGSPRQTCQPCFLPATLLSVATRLSRRRRRCSWTPVCSSGSECSGVCCYQPAPSGGAAPSQPTINGRNRLVALAVPDQATKPHLIPAPAEPLVSHPIRHRRGRVISHTPLIDVVHRSVARLLHKASRPGPAEHHHYLHPTFRHPRHDDGD